MKRAVLYLIVPLLAASASLLAQTAPLASGTSESSSPPTPVAKSFQGKAGTSAAPAPFSRLAVGVGVGVMGINMQAAVEANRHLNVRGIGNYFAYSLTNVKVSGSGGSSGINVNGNLNFASAGIAVDYYPFPNHGFRLSPGVMLYNQNAVTASGTASSGTSISLGSTKYYSEAGTNAMTVNAGVGLNTHQQAFTMTAGWGNMISRKGGHLSFPFELGAVFTGVPTLTFNLGGYGCTNSADVGTSGAGKSCVNMTTNATAQANLATQVAKYQNDLNPLKVYPILSGGIAYNFRIR